ncbi:macB [Symbiodinium microadriaticum]|nr:macB [Symbiodinium microadriaticum]
MFDYGGTIFRVDDKVFSEKNGFFADPSALDILDVELIHGTDMDQLTQGFQAYASDNSREDTEGYGFYYEPQFQSITDIHLHSSSFQWENANIGNYQSVLFLSIAAVIILVIACLNFINLSTVQAIKRAREVGVRKFVGATKPQLLLQYGIEAFLYCLTAALVAAMLVGLNIDNFNLLSGKEFELKNVFSLSHLSILAVGVLAISIFSGWYPAVLITKIQPIRVLHGASPVGLSIRNRRWKFDQKQLLVGGQYVLSIGLILISLIVNNQFSYLQNKDMGFRKDHLVSIRLTGSMYNDFKATRNAFVSHSAIENVSLCYGVPGGIVAGDGAWFPRIQDHELSSSMIMADPYYISTMDIKLTAGRDFSSDLTSDAAEAFIINETAARNLGFNNVEDALGEPVRWKMWTQEDTFKVGRVIGVVSDFNYKSLHHEVGNVIIHMDPNFSYMLIRMNAGQIQEGLAFLEEKYEEFSPTRPFEYEFVDQSFAKFYENEQRTSRLFSIFTLLAIFTASIGLFGLVSYTVANKGKEISIRKVLGAGTQSIFSMLVKKYLLLTSFCMVIALPIAYYVSGLWLDNFAYRTTIDAGLFVLVAVITLIVTMITVGFQAWQGAISNPADKLRAE